MRWSAAQLTCSQTHKSCAHNIKKHKSYECKIDNWEHEGICLRCAHTCAERVHSPAWFGAELCCHSHRICEHTEAHIVSKWKGHGNLTIAYAAHVAIIRQEVCRQICCSLTWVASGSDRAPQCTPETHQWASRWENEREEDTHHNTDHIHAYNHWRSMHAPFIQALRSMESWNTTNSTAKGTRHIDHVHKGLVVVVYTWGTTRIGLA